jgi:hypothetical protein
LKTSAFHRLVLALAAAFLAAPTRAEGPIVITHPGVSISADDVRDVFLGEKQIAGNVKLVPIDNAAMQSTFLARVIKLDPAKYATAWTKKSFRDGLNPPAVKSSDAEVTDFVKRTPGAVGYVGAAFDGAGVKIVK